MIPAAGKATRLSPLPCSKELYPIGSMQLSDGCRAKPKVVCQYLLERMQLAGITKAYIVLRDGKWDIPAYLGDGTNHGMNLAYVMMGLPYGTPYSVDQAFPFVKDAVVALGFPDILFKPGDGFIKLLSWQATGTADVVLGLFPADQPRKVDMVQLEDSGKRIRRIVIKPSQTHLHFTWGIAVWTPAFTAFMHNYVASKDVSVANHPELFVGSVIQAAIDDGMRVEGLQVSEDPFLDIGTPEDLVRAVNSYGAPSEMPNEQ